MKFVEDKLQLRFKTWCRWTNSITAYDMERRSRGQKVQLEVKGLSAEGNVELHRQRSHKAAANSRTELLPLRRFRHFLTWPAVCIWSRRPVPGGRSRQAHKSNRRFGNVNAIGRLDSASD